tara:strand:+ start:2760 stop:3515 length:756 start_codon:yes stop_codon:yes gene_type:complete
MDALRDVAFLKNQSDEMKVTVDTGLPDVTWRQLTKQPEPTRVEITRGPKDRHMLMWTILGALAALAALFLSSCSTPPRTVFDELTRNAGEWPTPSPAVAVRLDGSTPSAYAHAIVRHSNKLARVPGGLPIAIIDGRPITGKPFRVGWTTRPTAPFPNAKTALLVSTVPPDGEHPIIGGEGAHLMVPPNLVLVPNDERVPFLTQHAGVVELNITFPASSKGATFWLQLLVEDGRVGAGFVPSPVVAIMVGDR